MDTGESGARQSGFNSANTRHDIYSHYPRDLAAEQHSREPPNMAAAALMSPASAYHPHSTSFAPTYSSHPPPVSMPGIVSPGEHLRRTSKESEPAQRQSLPSISEMFSAKPRSYSPTTPTSMAASQPLPPPPPPHPYTAAAPPRPEPGPESRPPPPPPHFTPRQEVSGPPSGYQYGADQREHVKPAEPIQRNGGYASSHVSPVPYPPSQLPPGQLPLSQAPPISPRHLGPIMPPFESQRPPVHEEYNAGRARYDTSTLLKHHFETYDYTHCLQQISNITHTLGNFAEAYGSIASEQHSGQPISQRLPSEREVAEMLANVDYLRRNVETVRDVVQQSIANEKAREGGRHKGPYEDEDVSMYGDSVKQHYGLGEVKKRRGRAAPPGRCHSCNRIDTPEWRRGPDGARTLCNACGLHYAKLERKRQMEQRSMRANKTVE